MAQIILHDQSSFPAPVDSNSKCHSVADLLKKLQAAGHLDRKDTEAFWEGLHELNEQNSICVDDAATENPKFFDALPPPPHVTSEQEILLHFHSEEERDLERERNKKLRKRFYSRQRYRKAVICQHLEATVSKHGMALGTTTATAPKTGTPAAGLAIPSPSAKLSTTTATPTAGLATSSPSTKLATPMTEAAVDAAATAELPITSPSAKLAAPMTVDATPGASPSAAPSISSTVLLGEPFHTPAPKTVTVDGVSAQSPPATRSHTPAPEMVDGVSAKQLSNHKLITEAMDKMAVRASEQARWDHQETMAQAGVETEKLRLKTAQENRKKEQITTDGEARQLCLVAMFQNLGLEVDLAGSKKELFPKEKKEEATLDTATSNLSGESENSNTTQTPLAVARPVNTPGSVPMAHATKIVKTPKAGTASDNKIATTLDNKIAPDKMLAPTLLDLDKLDGASFSAVFVPIYNGNELSILPQDSNGHILWQNSDGSLEGLSLGGFQQKIEMLHSGVKSISQFCSELASSLRKDPRYILEECFQTRAVKSLLANNTQDRKLVLAFGEFTLYFHSKTREFVENLVSQSGAKSFQEIFKEIADSCDIPDDFCLTPVSKWKKKCPKLKDRALLGFLDELGDTGVNSIVLPIYFNQGNVLGLADGNSVVWQNEGGSLAHLTLAELQAEMEQLSQNKSRSEFAHQLAWGLQKDPYFVFHILEQRASSFATKLVNSEEVSDDGMDKAMSSTNTMKAYAMFLLHKY